MPTNALVPSAAAAVPPPKASSSGNRHRPSKNSNSDTTKHREAIQLYLETIVRGQVPSRSLLISSIRSCSLLPSASHAHVIKFGLGSDRFVGCSLVALYSLDGPIGSARRVFDGIVKKDAALYTAMVAGYARNSDIDGARDLFDRMPMRDVVAWNAMMSGYVECGFPECALDLFRRMQSSDGVEPNEVTLLIALSACSHLGWLHMGEWIHAYVGKVFDGCVQVMPKLYNSLVHMYAKCGRLDVALQLFIEKEDKNLELWNAIVTGFAVHGCGTAALSLLSQMIKSGRVPDRITFIGLLMACSHAGIVEHAQRLFLFMGGVCGIEPGPEHYGCMVDVLSRAGRLEEAYALVRSMPFEGDDAHVWGALLNGCFKHSSYELGLEAASHLLELQPWNESRYIALINLLVLVGRVDDAIEIRRKMLDAGVKKSSACSMVEVDGVVHEFIAGDRSHCRSRDIYSMLEFVGKNSNSEDNHV